MVNRVAYVPENLDLVNHIRKYPPRFKDFRYDKAIFILSQVNEIPARNKKIADKYIDGKTPINILMLRENGIRDGHLYLKYFTKSGILDCDNHFIVGEKSRCYKFSDKYTVPVKPLIIPSKNRQTPEDYLRDKFGSHFLGKWFNPHLQIDYDEAVAHINRIRNQSRGGTKDQFLKATRSYVRQYININDIDCGEYWFNPGDQTSGRVHSILTIIRKDLRQFISYDGKPLASSDIKNSQPLILSCVMDKGFWSQNTPNTNIYKYLSSKQIKEIDTNTITMTISEVDTDSQDVVLYKNLVSEGKFYDFMCIKFAELVDDKYRDRGKTKKAMLWVLFDKNGMISPERMAFETLFPTVAIVCELIRNKEHELLAVLLQKIEVDIVINRACKRLSRVIPNIPIYTIHDSIIVVDGYQGIVSSIMEEELIKVIGESGRMEPGKWSSDI